MRSTGEWPGSGKQATKDSWVAPKSGFSDLGYHANFWQLHNGMVPQVWILRHGMAPIYAVTVLTDSRFNTQHLHNHALRPLTVELGVKHALPRTQIEPAAGYRQRRLVMQQQ